MFYVGVMNERISSGSREHTSVCRSQVKPAMDIETVLKAYQKQLAEIDSEVHAHKVSRLLSDAWTLSR